MLEYIKNKKSKIQIWKANLIDSFVTTHIGPNGEKMNRMNKT
jgi:hypothetical protein